MNFLAHIFLSPPDEYLMLGNCFGDFVNAKSFAQLDSRIQKGVLLHRFIDQSTDQNRHFRQSVALLRPTQGKYAAVLVDLFYDYCLAKNFALFSPLSLNDFAQKTYAGFCRISADIPVQWQPVVENMIENNWLVHYATPFGIQKSLENLSKRAKFAHQMEQAWQDLEKNYSQIRFDFLNFFPQIYAECELWKEKNT